MICCKINSLIEIGFRQSLFLFKSGSGRVNLFLPKMYDHSKLNIGISFEIYSLFGVKYLT